MELDRVPLAVADPARDVGGHRGLGLTWVTRTGRREEEESVRRQRGEWGVRKEGRQEEAREMSV